MSDGIGNQKQNEEELGHLSKEKKKLPKENSMSSDQLELVRDNTTVKAASLVSSLLEWIDLDKTNRFERSFNNSPDQTFEKSITDTRIQPRENYHSDSTQTSTDLDSKDPLFWISTNNPDIKEVHMMWARPRKRSKSRRTSGSVSTRDMSSVKESITLSTKSSENMQCSSEDMQRAPKPQDMEILSKRMIHTNGSIDQPSLENEAVIMKKKAVPTGSNMKDTEKSFDKESMAITTKGLPRDADGSMASVAQGSNLTDSDEEWSDAFSEDTTAAKSTSDKVYLDSFSEGLSSLYQSVKDGVPNLSSISSPAGGGIHGGMLQETPNTSADIPQASQSTIVQASPSATLQNSQDLSQGPKSTSSQQGLADAARAPPSTLPHIPTSSGLPAPDDLLQEKKYSLKQPSLSPVQQALPDASQAPQIAMGQTSKSATLQSSKDVSQDSNGTSQHSSHIQQASPNVPQAPKRTSDQAELDKIHQSPKDTSKQASQIGSMGATKGNSNKDERFHRQIYDNGNGSGFQEQEKILMTEKKLKSYQGDSREDKAAENEDQDKGKKFTMKDTPLTDSAEVPRAGYEPQPNAFSGVMLPDLSIHDPEISSDEHHDRSIRNTLSKTLFKTQEESKSILDIRNKSRLDRSLNKSKSIIEEPKFPSMSTPKTQGIKGMEVFLDDLSRRQNGIKDAERGTDKRNQKHVSIQDVSTGQAYIGIPQATSTPKPRGQTSKISEETTPYPASDSTSEDEKSRILPVESVLWDQINHDLFITREHARILNFMDNVRPNTRLIGEVAFQLERYILRAIFEDAKKYKYCKKRFHGYTLRNLEDMITKEAQDRKTGEVDMKIESKLRWRLRKLLNVLTPLFYSHQHHGSISVDLINKYGLLPFPTDKSIAALFCLRNKDFIADYLKGITQREEVSDVMILLECLALMAKNAGTPLFVW